MWKTQATIVSLPDTTISIVERAGNIGIFRQRYTAKGVEKAGEIFTRRPLQLLRALSGDPTANTGLRLRRDDDGVVTLSDGRFVLSLNGRDIPEIEKALSQICRQSRQDAKP